MLGQSPRIYRSTWKEAKVLAPCPSRAFGGQLEPPCQLWEQAVLQGIPQLLVDTPQMRLSGAEIAVPLSHAQTAS